MSMGYYYPQVIFMKMNMMDLITYILEEPRSLKMHHGFLTD